MTYRFALLLALLATASSAAAATFTVDSAEDAPDAAPGDGRCATAAATCTLRAAIEEANALGGDDAITLPAGTYVAPSVGVGGFIVASNVSLEGAGAITTVLEGGPFGAVVVVEAGAALTARRLTVANGKGLGIRNRGTLHLTDCTVRGNAPAGISNAGTLTLTRALVTLNLGGLAGGLVNEIGATATVVDSVFSYNFGAPYGGLFNNSGATATVTGSAVIGNLGDGVGNSGTLVVTNSTVSGNHVGTSAFVCGFAEARLELANVTIAGNATAISSSSGAGISGTCAITIRNSLIAGNDDHGTERNCGATLTSQGHNLIRLHPLDPCTIQGDTTGNLTGRDPLLGPLADHGGPTPTHALLPASPAIDAGNPALPGSGGSACAAADQRGVARGGRCDIGAYEAGGPPPPPPPPPARFIVDDTGMEPDAYPGDGACRTAAGTCTLAAAMLEAQALPGADTIDLGEATYTLDRIDHEELGLSVGLPTVTSDLTVAGKGAGRTRLVRVPAGARSVVARAFSVHAGRLTLRGVTIAGPSRRGPGDAGIEAVLAPVTVEDSEFTGNSAGIPIRTRQAHLSLRGVTFRQNAKDPTVAGGTLVDAREGGLDVDGCTFEDNTGFPTLISGRGFPGETYAIRRSAFRRNSTLAPAVAGAMLDVSDSLFEGNVNAAGGSGAAALGGARTITRCTFRDNQTGGHGGAVETVGELSVVDSTFAGNTAAFDGGAIYVLGVGLDSFVSITNSTFSANAASGDGGAIYNDHGRLRLRNVTIADNRSFAGRGGGIWLPSPDPFTADVADMQHVILAGNRDARGEAPDCHAPRDPTIGTRESPKLLRSLGHNLVGDATGCRFLGETGDQIGTAAAPLDPLLADLADNGGPTMTHALLAGSPAVDAGDPAGCTAADGIPLTTDQRGFSRPVDGDLDGITRCDLGAFELGATPATTTTTTTATTTTTLPPGEVCGNCADDDQNGLTDFEDPACCGGPSESGLIVKRLRIKPKGGRHVLKVSGTLTGGDANPLVEDVFLQMRQGAEVLCAQLPAARFVRKKKPFKFTDKTLAVPAAQGIAKAVLAPRKDGSAKLVAKGKQVVLDAPRGGATRVTVALHPAGSATGRCVAVDAGLEAGKKGALRFP